MIISIIPSEKLIRRDEIAVKIPKWDFNDNHIDLIEWQDGQGIVEFKKDSIVNSIFSDVSILQPYIDQLEKYTDTTNLPNTIFDEELQRYVLVDNSTFNDTNESILNNILESQDTASNETKKAWIYIHVPKTAGSFIKSRIKESTKTSKILDPFVNNTHFSTPVKNAPTISFVKKHIELANDAAINFIAIVRNPYDRIYSLWKWSRIYGLPGNLEFPEVEPVFDDFVSSLGEGNYDHYYFMQKQTFFLKDHDERLKIIKFEDLNTDAKLFFEENGVTWSNTKVNATPGKDYISVYNENLIEIVKERCLEEFQMFGYSTDLV